jgi:hypothetical protein
MKKCIVFLGILMIYSDMSATNYYLSISTGKDIGRAGTSEASPWKTISMVNSIKFLPGDSVFFKRGEVWRETLIVPSSGIASKYLVFATYGTGTNPRILGSERTTWSNYGINIWVSDKQFTDPEKVGTYGSEIFFENRKGKIAWGVERPGIGSLTAEYEWAYSNGKIYVFSSSDPDDIYKSVEIPQRASIINLNEKNYLHFKGFDILYCGESAITYHTYPMQSHTGLIVEYCNIGYVSKKNSEAGYGIDATYSDQIVRHCEIHNCGRRGISHHLYGTFTATNILIEENYFHDGFHTTGPDLSVGSSSSSYYGSIDGVIIRRNKFYDPPTNSFYAHQIFLQNYLYSNLKAQLKNIYIYSNIFISPTGAAINMEGTQSVYVYNNTFYNHSLKGSFHLWIDNNNSLVKVKNNIFYTSLPFDKNGVGSGVFIRSGQNVESLDIDHNLYYRVNNKLRIMEKEGRNLYYIGNFNKVRSEFGWETNSPSPSDPQFTDAANDDFRLNSTSPAIGNGIDLKITLDYSGRTFNKISPSIGAFESGKD